ncbi:acetylornithine deacetylase [Citrobacter koseri]|uniref:Acetylornithine deacetylase n=1 Tax=Citrobacter koseri TaxID=545 RepID=A0A2X2WEL0_CITKO|nr:acetylornithine deacetylase [Citrobacter koseri]
MKNTLPPFIEIYRALIATPSISATEEALDQSNGVFNHSAGRLV